MRAAPYILCVVLAMSSSYINLQYYISFNRDLAPARRTQTSCACGHGFEKSSHPILEVRNQQVWQVALGQSLRFLSCAQIWSVEQRKRTALRGAGFALALVRTHDETFLTHRFAATKTKTSILKTKTWSTELSIVFFFQARDETHPTVRGTSLEHQNFQRN